MPGNLVSLDTSDHKTEEGAPAPREARPLMDQLAVMDGLTQKMASTRFFFPGISAKKPRKNLLVNCGTKVVKIRR